MNGFDPELAWIAAGAALLTALVDGLARRGLGRRASIGDEVEYLARVGSAEPWRHDPFLRVPLHALLLWAAGRGFGGAGGPERGIDVLLHLVAMATAAAVSLAAGVLEGPLAALCAGALWALLPDRWTLSRRLWPDTTLALSVSGVLLWLACAVDGRSPRVAILGLLLAAAVALRIDALILIPVVAGFLSFGSALDVASSLALVVPATIVLGGLALFHGHREGRYWPDDTVLFNWRVSRADRLARPLEATMATLGARWREEAGRVGTNRSPSRDPERDPPWAERLWRAASLAGQDSFAREKLLAEDAGAFPDALPRVRRVASAILRLSFPVLLALALASLVSGWPRRIDLLVSGALLLAPALFTARTRYRFAALPGLAMAAGAGCAALVEGTFPGQPEVWIILIGGAALLFAVAPRRAERAVLRP